jgi:hypothetical protein
MIVLHVLAIWTAASIAVVAGWNLAKRACR